MKLDTQNARYVALVITALVSGTLGPEDLTDTCPECGVKVVHTQDLDHIDPLHHLTIEHEDREIVVIGCEGYWVINPNSVGFTSETWMDWRSAEDLTPGDIIGPSWGPWGPEGRPGN